MIEPTAPAEQVNTHGQHIRRVEQRGTREAQVTEGNHATEREQTVPGERVSPIERVIPGERISPVSDVIPAEQVTPRVAVSDAADAWFALLPSASRERLLAVMNLLGELAEMVPPSGRSWDATRQPSGAFALEFGAVVVRYRIDESDASLVIEGVSPHPR